MDSSNKRVVLVLALIAINLLFTIKATSLATPVNPSFGSQSREASVIDGAVVANTALPEGIVSEPEIIVVTVTAYSSTPEQTDDTPFITASGSSVRDGVVASSFLPFGTQIKLPKMFGDKIFVVEDKMNSRYAGQSRIDIWFEDHSKAQAFGVRTLKAEIL